MCWRATFDWEFPIEDARQPSLITREYLATTAARIRQLRYFRIGIAEASCKSISMLNRLSICMNLTACLAPTAFLNLE
jgi:hypothetical protein